MKKHLCSTPLFSLPQLPSQRSRFGQSWGTVGFDSNDGVAAGDERSPRSNQGPEAEYSSIEVTALVATMEHCGHTFARDTRPRGIIPGAF